MKDLNAQLKELNKHFHEVLPQEERKKILEASSNLQRQIDQKKSEIAYKFVKELQDQDLTAHEAISLLERSQEIIRHSKFITD